MASTTYWEPTQTWSTTRVTGFVELHNRAVSSSTHKSSTSKCSNKQQCEHGTSTNGLTIGLAIGIPVFVFLSIIGVFVIRAYRKNKKEDAEENDNDPDYYGESTVLPEYPKRRGNQQVPPQFDDASVVSSHQNPFNGGQQRFARDNTRYPSAVFNPQQQTQSRAPSMPNDHATEHNYEGFTIPYQHSFGSKHSLDDYAKHVGGDYQAYGLANSAVPSRPQSPYISPSSSQLDVSKHNVRNLMEKDDFTTDSSNSYRQEKESPIDSVNRNTVTEGEVPYVGDDYDDSPDAFADPKMQNARRQSGLSFIESEPEMLNQKTVAFSTHPEMHEVEREGPDEEEDEDIKRMKSVYRVYFDRENSVKSTKTLNPGNDDDDEEEVPPLPQMPSPVAFNEPAFVKSVQEENEPEEFPEVSGYFDEPEAESTQDEPEFLTVSAKKQRAVSSVYSTVPLQYGQYGQEQQQQQQPTDQHLRYQPQDYQPQPVQQQHSGQPPSQYYQYSGRQQQPPPQQYQQAPPQQYQQFQPPTFTGKPRYEQQVSELPSANRINYDSIVSDTQFAPTKSFTGDRPQLAVRPFDPLQYSDQIFSPTSPNSPNSPQFGSVGSAPPAPHHMRQSIVMMNPVEIGKQKIYRPAGAFSQINSANSSRAGSLTSQSAYAPPQGHDELPRSGSQSDLRKQLGSSDNYHFV